MRQKLIEAVTWALRLKPDPAALKWPVAVLAAAFFGLLLFAVFQYQTSERRWGMKLVLGLLGGATVVGLGASAFHWLTGVLYGVGYLLTWLVWVLTKRWLWWRQALARGLTAGLTIGPWLWVGATEKAMLTSEYSRRLLPEWLVTRSAVIWFWMLLGSLWLLVLVGGWGCWRWPMARQTRRRWLVGCWAVMGIFGLNWYLAGRVDLFAACEQGHRWRLGYLLVSRPGSQWYRGTFGATPLHAAALDGHAEAIRLLLTTRADVNAQAIGGATPLHVAAYVAAVDSNAEAIRLLVAARADANATTNAGWTPLHWAAVNGHVEAIKVLLAAGADINAKTNDGQAPLHGAALNGEAEAIRLLLAGAKVNERNIQGETALDVAKSDECRTLLRAAGGKTGAELDTEKAAGRGHEALRP